MTVKVGEVCNSEVTALDREATILVAASLMRRQKLG